MTTNRGHDLQRNILIPNDEPFIIAEMSANHKQSLDQALDIVTQAAKAGVDALKLQTFTPQTMTLDVNSDEFVISDPASIWYGYSLYALYEKAAIPWEWHKPIFNKCQECGIVGFSTPFDSTAVDFLEECGVPLYKISSFENCDIPLIEKCAATGKPLIISTGLASVSELEEAVNAARRAGCQDLTLLKCTSSYPAEPEDANLRTLSHLSELFQCRVGISDHTMGIAAAIVSIVLGGNVIEKHFTLKREEGDLDGKFSLEPTEMQRLVLEVRQAAKMLGKVHYGLTKRELGSLQFKRSLYVTQDILKGDALTSENIRAIRPGNGLKPKYYHQVLGYKAKKDLKKGTALHWDLIYD